MVFSDTDTKQGIVQDIDFTCGTNDTSYPIADKTRHINQHYSLAVADVLLATKRLQFGDRNLTTNSPAKFDLVADQSQYSLPLELLRYDSFEILDSAGTPHRLTEAQDVTSLKDFGSTSGMPTRYMIRYGSLHLDPAPSATDVTLTAGGLIYGLKDVDLFASDDTTQVPAFTRLFHKIISLGASWEYLRVNNPEKATSVKSDYEQERAEMKRFLRRLNSDSRDGFKPAHKTKDFV